MDRPPDERPGEDSRLATFQAMYLDGRIDGVSLVAADSTACAACLELADRAYLPSQLPRLPIGSCSRGGGCRCRYEPNITVYE
jgi:hypothetical protein